LLYLSPRVDLPNVDGSAVSARAELLLGEGVGAGCADDRLMVLAAHRGLDLSVTHEF
jgi:hypothetical protein